MERLTLSYLYPALQMRPFQGLYKFPNITPSYHQPAKTLFLISSIIGAQNKLVFRINGKNTYRSRHSLMRKLSSLAPACHGRRAKLQDPVRAVFLRVFQSVDIRHDDLILARRRFGIGVPGNGAYS